LPTQILAFAILLISSRAAVAAHLLRFEVSIDGLAALETGTVDHDESADTAWRHLKDLKLSPIKGYQVEPAKADPLRAELNGKVIIQCAEAGRAEVSELHLVRAQEDAPWTVDAAEVERTLTTRHKPFVFVVSIDGNEQLATGLQTRSGPLADDPNNVWQDLKRLKIVPIQRYVVAPDENNPLHATLKGTPKGNVVIELKYDGQPSGRADVSELKLVRERPNAPWKVDPAEVERTLARREVPNVRENHY
jgi:hypothetical protein